MNYTAEADIFLRRMPAGLQHRQAVAVEQAIPGNYEALTHVRNSRNTEITIPKGIHHTILTHELHLYRPDSGKKKLPLLIYLHGGGWAFGSVNSCAIAQENIAVMAVNYRLSPDNAYPAALIDIREALRYAHQHADELGIDTNQIFLGGDSAGGNLALAALGVRTIYQLVPGSVHLFITVDGQPAAFQLAVQHTVAFINAH